MYSCPATIKLVDRCLPRASGDKSSSICHLCVMPNRRVAWCVGGHPFTQPLLGCVSNKMLNPAFHSLGWQKEGFNNRSSGKPLTKVQNMLLCCQNTNVGANSHGTVGGTANPSSKGMGGTAAGTVVSDAAVLCRIELVKLFGRAQWGILRGGGGGWHWLA